MLDDIDLLTHSLEGVGFTFLGLHVASQRVDGPSLYHVRSHKPADKLYRFGRKVVAARGQEREVNAKGRQRRALGVNVAGEDGYAGQAVKGIFTRGIS